MRGWRLLDSGEMFKDRVLQSLKASDDVRELADSDTSLSQLNVAVEQAELASNHATAATIKGKALKKQIEIE